MDSFVTLLPDNYLRLMINYKSVKFSLVSSKNGFVYRRFLGLVTRIK